MSARRPFLPLDVSFMDDEKIVEAGPIPSWFYLAMLLGCKRFGTDGILTHSQCARLGVDKWRKSVETLIEVGLILDISEDQISRKKLWIPSWSKWNLSQEEREIVRQNARVAANIRWGKHPRSDANRNAPGIQSADAKKRREEKRSESAAELSTFTDRLAEKIIEASEA